MNKGRVWVRLALLSLAWMSSFLMACVLLIPAALGLLPVILFLTCGSLCSTMQAKSRERTLGCLIFDELHSFRFFRKIMFSKKFEKLPKEAKIEYDKEHLFEQIEQRGKKFCFLSIPWEGCDSTDKFLLVEVVDPGFDKFWPEMKRRRLEVK